MKYFIMKYRNIIFKNENIFNDYFHEISNISFFRVHYFRTYKYNSTPLIVNNIFTYYYYYYHY